MRNDDKCLYRHLHRNLALTDPSGNNGLPCMSLRLAHRYLDFSFPTFLCKSEGQKFQHIQHGWNPRRLGRLLIMAETMQRYQDRDDRLLSASTQMEKYQSIRASSTIHHPKVGAYLIELVYNFPFYLNRFYNLLLLYSC